MSFAHVPSHISLPPSDPAPSSSAENLLLFWHCNSSASPPRLPSPAAAARLPCAPQAASTTEHQMGWHRLVSWPNGCLFKHWGCLHCCGSLHVKHSPVKPYANPIKVSAVQCGEAITRWSQVCLRSSRKENLIEQLKGKSDSAQHHVEDTRLNCSQVFGGQREINEGPEEHVRNVTGPWASLLGTPAPASAERHLPVLPLGFPLSSFLLFLFHGVYLLIF